MKIIILGAGEVGFHIAQRLSRENQDVVLIDKDPEKISRINENLDVQAILGSGTSPEMLRDSGIRGAEIIIPIGDSIIRPKDHLINFTLEKVVPKLEKLLTVKLEYF